MKVLVACLVLCAVLAYVQPAPQCGGRRSNNATTISPDVEEVDTLQPFRQARDSEKIVANSNANGQRQLKRQGGQANQGTRRGGQANQGTRRGGQANQSTRQGGRNQRRRSTEAPDA